jgi:hypothetical protein
MRFLLSNAWLAAFAQIDLKNATIKIKDGGSEELEVTVGEGNLVYTERRNIEYTRDRGNLDEVREGDQEPMEVRLDFVWEYLKSGPAATSSGVHVITVEDALKNSGSASDWTSTDADACRPYAVDIEVHYDPSPAGCGDEEVITLSDFRYEQLEHDLRAGTVSVTGRCNVTGATVLRQTNST